MQNDRLIDLQTFDFNDEDGAAVTETFRLSEVARVRNDEEKVTIYFQFSNNRIKVQHSPFNDEALSRFYRLWQDFYASW